MSRLNRNELPAVQFITHRTARYGWAESAQLALECGLRWIQFRCKDALSYPQLREEAMKVQTLCHRYDALFVVDDFAELAAGLQADGVHLGKNDMPIEQARHILGPRFLIGGTANTLLDMERIQAQGGDYIGLGPFRFTRTKEKLSPVLGVEGYARLMKEAREAGITLPVYAIGGITGEDAPALKQAGVQGLAVSSALLQSPSPKEEAARLLSPFLSLT